ncbi:uncharacterized protein BDR25DRAFT_302916 [Lindgomyces ingoldianus]|uniref:Uncharacterized protein n=1 Tax=Lindgomyces ingoldianus TaxID=673940 RepID=A0ACB6QYT7_9PLEO|nr:uncharacterized protein BDR25DRAFT_302916 [Lindgomyces ingoldianus]KAF2472154.1 hypothetical protein BDR25DRAFT_302916 [Lindgomyces ingoldianus]
MHPREDQASSRPHHVQESHSYERTTSPGAGQSQGTSANCSFTQTNGTSPSQTPTQQNGYSYNPSPAQGPGQPYMASSYWHPVPRTWGAVNPEAYLVTQSPALNYPLTAPHQNPAQPNLPNHQAPQNAPQNAPQTQVPATISLANLNQLNSNHLSSSTMAIWMNEGQREDAWHSTGYVPREDEGWRER